MSLGLSSSIETLKNARQKPESRESQLKRFKKIATDVVHLTAKESQAPEKTNIKESYNKSSRPHTPNRERQRQRLARTRRATQQSEKTTDSEHIGPPECQSSLSRRQFRVKQFFFRHYFGRMGTYSNKQTRRKEATDLLTHAGTQQHRRMRRRPIQSIFEHQNVSLRCRDDSSAWNSSSQTRIYIFQKSSGKK